MTEISNLNLTEKELTRAKALEEKILNYIQTHNIKRDQCNKYSKKLRISNSDKNLLKRYYFLDRLATKLYVEKLRNNIKGSQQFCLEHGIWTSKAPLGYVNYRDKKGRAQIKVDSERLQKIYKLFLARRDGSSLKDLYQLAKDKNKCSVSVANDAAGGPEGINRPAIYNQPAHFYKSPCARIKKYAIFPFTRTSYTKISLFIKALV